MQTTRRELLGGGAAILGGGLAGCSSFAGNCDGANRSSIETEREAPPEDHREAVDPIGVSELPDSERTIAETAIEASSYVECKPASKSFSSLLNRIRDREREQQRRSDADLTTVYFAAGDAHYALVARELDMTISE
ncbi:hypothetical protein BRC82_04700 [Halobacteriales archaeon QS_1_67_19]|nr:MAG: hypothetical protein BRC82_04700 [Halobacteriales archaeon QS_1_67_19]